MDTGSGHDLISRNVASDSVMHNIKHMDEPVTLSTANGLIRVDDRLPLKLRSVNSSVAPLVLDSCPSVLSIGKRCMEEGWEFVWRPNKPPYIKFPNGKQIQCVVKGNVPYLPDTVPAPVDLCAPAPEDDDGIPAVEGPARLLMHLLLTMSLMMISQETRKMMTTYSLRILARAPLKRRSPSTICFHTDLRTLIVELAS